MPRDERVWGSCMQASVYGGKAEEVGNGEGERGARSEREKGNGRLVVGVDPELCRGFGDGDLLEAGELGTNRQ